MYTRYGYTSERREVAPEAQKHRLSRIEQVRYRMFAFTVRVVLAVSSRFGNRMSSRSTVAPSCHRRILELHTVFGSRSIEACAGACHARALIASICSDAQQTQKYNLRSQAGRRAMLIPARLPRLASTALPVFDMGNGRLLMQSLRSLQRRSHVFGSDAVAMYPNAVGRQDRAERSTLRSEQVSHSRSNRYKVCLYWVK